MVELDHSDFLIRGLDTLIDIAKSAISVQKYTEAIAAVELYSTILLTLKDVEVESSFIHNSMEDSLGLNDDDDSI